MLRLMNWRLLLGSKSDSRQKSVVQALNRKKCLVLRDGELTGTQWS